MTHAAPSTYLNGYVDGSRIVFLYRNESRELCYDTKPAEWVTYHKTSDITPDFARVIRGSRFVQSTTTEGAWLRIHWSDRDARNLICVLPDNPFAKSNVGVYEGDVHPVRRYMTDNEVFIARPRRMYFDLETDSRVPFVQKERARILSWAIVAHDTGEVWSGMLEEDTDAAERKLLDEFWRITRDFDQCCAWNGEGFDFPVLFSRTKLRGCRVDTRHWLWLDHLLVFKRMNLSESGDEKVSLKLGAVAMSLLGDGKDDFDGSKTWQAWSAGSAERERMLKYNIKDTTLLRRIEEETGYLELFQTLAESCGVFPNTLGLNPTIQVDAFMLRLAREESTHFATKQYAIESKKFEGAYVQQPDFKGITRNVHVADFAALYPSIMISWNMSPETRRTNGLRDLTKAEHAAFGELCDAMKDEGPPRPGRSKAALTEVEFEQGPVGMLPRALMRMLSLRVEWNAKKSSLPPGTPEWHDADRRTTAYKVAANSFYGVIGSPYSRYFDRFLAESCTQCGVYLIQQTKEEAAKRGMHIGYVDTDSIFVSNTTEQAFGEFVKWCNAELYPRLLRERGCIENRIKLAYEKEFRIVVFTGKKRYAGKYEHYKGKRATAESKPEIKGLEFKRGDTALLARRLQGSVINLLVTHEVDDIAKFQEIVSAARKHVLDEPLTVEEVAIAKTLTKKITTPTFKCRNGECGAIVRVTDEKCPTCGHEYEAEDASEYYVERKKNDGTAFAPLAHVKVARELQERGVEVIRGTKIAYVTTDAKERLQVIPADDYKGDLDRFYLWEKLVWPPTERFLEAAFPDYDWSVWGEVRPKSPRKRRGKPANPDQVDLFTSESTPSVVVQPPTMSGDKPKMTRRRKAIPTDTA